MAKVEVTFNDHKIKTDSEITILDLARQQGVDIPTLCYDPRLEPFGSCFVCIVEVKGAKTLVPACATQLREGMEIYTNSEKVISSRKTALELMLSNHYGDCFGPCQLACPARCDAQGYTGLIASGRYRDALKVVKDTIPMPASIGRVCPKFCELDCRRQNVEEPVAIAHLKRFIADLDLESENPYLPDVKEKTGQKVAVVGGGPAGLATAFFLIQEGITVDIFESQALPGGMLHYGIPQYRLPKDILAREIRTITDLGVNIHYNQTLGKDFTLEELKARGYAAVALCIGAWKAYKLGIPNEDARGVFDGIEFLKKIANQEKIQLHGRVAIVGGGNTAFDCARSAVRLGADEVVMVYRRTRDEMPANETEIIEAEEEGVQFKILTAPLKVEAAGEKVIGLYCQKMYLGEPDQSGRRRPMPISNSEYSEIFDFVISAVGQGPDISTLSHFKDQVSTGKWIKYNEATGQTPLDYLFVAGDCATGAATVVEAFAGAKKAALSILQYINDLPVQTKKEFISKKEELAPINPEYYQEWEKESRKQIAVVAPEIRKNNFDEVDSVLSEQEAVAEAKRCIECGCMDVFQCQLKKYAQDYEAEYKYKGAVNLIKKDYSHPYLKLEPEKCVLCGRCVRLCSEEMKIGVYGYIKRGFDSLIAPEFHHPLLESDCVSCGLCISGCPVGAIVPAQPTVKSVPVKGTKIDSYCYHCSIGCATTFEILDNSIHDIYERENYLCRKGRFRQPYFIPKQTEKPNFKALKNFTNALVYPSPSLSCEDYEALKIAAQNYNWQLCNYYSQGSLWQAFAAHQCLPAMDFFTKPIQKNSLIIIAGNIEEINPIAINHLSQVSLEETKIIAINKNIGVRLSKLKAKLLTNFKAIAFEQWHTYREVIFLINPIDFDQKFGLGQSLNLYNTLIEKSRNLRTTLFSEAKNIYSFYDSHIIKNQDTKRKIYIQTIPPSLDQFDEKRLFSIQLFENDQLINVFPLALSLQAGGTHLNSKGQFYRNTPIFKQQMLNLQEIIQQELDETAPIQLKNSILEQKAEHELDYQPKSSPFPDDSFIIQFAK